MNFTSPSKLLPLLALVVGLFLFPLNGPLRAETAQAPTDTSASGELVFWNSIKKSENVADFEIYLKTFPDGMFAEIAQSRYKELGGTAAVAVPKVEEPVVAEPEATETAMPEPEQDADVKITKPKKKAAVVYQSKPKKRASSVFVKKKKAKVILAYTKQRAKKKKIYITKSTRKYVKKNQQPVVAKAKYVKPKPKAVKKKKYLPGSEPLSGSGGGGGGGGAGGGGGGWGG